MAKLVIVWETGEKETHIYDSREKAIEAENGFRMVFGNQISWTGVQ